MSLEQFLENLTLEEIDELRRLKEQKQKSYNFSSLTMENLNNFFDVKKSFNKEEILSSWIKNKIEIQDEDLSFLTKLLAKEKEYIEIYKEEDLKVKFIAPILNQIDFRDEVKEIRDFYEEKITYKGEDFILTGVCDFVVSKGLDYAKKPYFFIQEFKKGFDSSDPRPQLLAELISSIELNNFDSIKGAYIVGAIWNFVILERLERHKYIYYVSENFDSTKIEDLKGIYKNLLFVKEEIIKWAEN